MATPTLLKAKMGAPLKGFIIKNIYKIRKIKAWIFVIFIAALSVGMSYIPAFAAAGISPLIISIILSVILANLMSASARLARRAGVIAIGTKQILRLGIILYGFRITLFDIAQIGVWGLFSAFFMVFSTFAFGLFVGRRLGLDRGLAALVASGSAVCGAAAVMATNALIKQDPSKAGLAVASVVVFGVLGMGVWPAFFYSGLGDLSAAAAGFMVGAGLHEVANAVAAGSAVGAGEAAVLLKMMRVAMLVPFLIVVALWWDFKNRGQNGGAMRSFPWFALWFLACIVAGSFIPEGIEAVILPAINLVDLFLLCVAMAAMGLTIDKSIFKNSGAKVFGAAAIIFVWLFGASFALAKFSGV